MTKAAPLRTMPPESVASLQERPRDMDTLARPADNPPTPYFSREAEFNQAVRDEEARRGLTPEPWAA